MEITVSIDDYFTEEKIRDIAEEELRFAFRNQIEQKGVEDVIAKLSKGYLKEMISEKWDGDFEEELKKQIKEAILKSTGFYVFKRKNPWDYSESPAIKILDEECRASRPLIKQCIEDHIKNYPFNELDREEIQWTIADVIAGMLFGSEQERC